MKQTLSQTCPLCGADAVFYFVDYKNRKHFECPHCTYYQITRHAESRLAHAPKEKLEQLSESAQRTPMDHLLVISASLQAPEEGRTSELITAKYLPKSELLERDML